MVVFDDENWNVLMPFGPLKNRSIGQHVGGFKHYLNGYFVVFQGASCLEWLPKCAVVESTSRVGHCFHYPFIRRFFYSQKPLLVFLVLLSICDCNVALLHLEQCGKVYLVHCSHPGRDNTHGAPVMIQCSHPYDMDATEHYSHQTFCHGKYLTLSVTRGF